MTYEDQVMDFLLQPENLPVALQVAEYVDKLKEKLHKKFWRLFTPVLQDRLESSEFSAGWRIEQLPERQWRSDWGKTFIRPVRTAGSKHPFLEVAFGQGPKAGGYRFFRGVRWAPTEPTSIGSKPYEDLGQLLRAKELTIVETNWPGWNYLNCHAVGEGFLLKMQHEPEAMIGELADEVWRLFVDTRPLIETINADVIASFSGAEAGE